MSEKLTPAPEEWRANLASDAETITRILGAMRRIAVLGIKTAESGGPAYTVPAYLQAHGYDVVPVPVYYPDITEILGVAVHRSLAEMEPPADLIQIFRRPEDIPPHVDDILAAEPSVVWMQLGIRHAEVAEILARVGIHVIQDRCLQVELDRRATR